VDAIRILLVLGGGTISLVLSINRLAALRRRRGGSDPGGGAQRWQ
jgi:hypothetical protein